MPDTNEFTFGRAELEAAVAKGVLDRGAANNLMEFLIESRNVTVNDPDEERLRLITGFNDIFVTIGIALFLGALAYLSGEKMIYLLPLASWLLAEIFTRRKRMALPSIALLVTFTVSMFFTIYSLISYGDTFPNFHLERQGRFVAIAGLLTAVFAAAHWYRFRVPITVAAGCAALITVIVGTIELLTPGALDKLTAFIFAPLGLAVFALAMVFDMSDRERRTRRNDIAFWLHLLAAPLIVHPLVSGFANVNTMGSTDAISVLALFVVLSLVALVIDRRALLVSSLLYLGYAVSTFVTVSSLEGVDAAVTVLLVGAIVLTISVVWQPMRRLVLKMMPEAVRLRVPAAAH